MLRVKIPYGKVEPDQLEMLGYIARILAAGATSPPAVHPVPLLSSWKTPSRCSGLASVGLTSREACGDTVRNVSGCHLAGVPYVRC
jgi:sulfite reductase beta subunit-like hemoprotein